MIRKRNMIQELDPPPIAISVPEAVEILRVWAAPNAPQQLTLRTCWSDPGAWGLLLVDIARHASKAYEREGKDPDKVFHRIKEAFDVEWSFPTDNPEDLTDKA